MHTERIVRSRRLESLSADLVSEAQVALALLGRISQQHSTPLYPGERCLQLQGGKLLLHLIREHRFGRYLGHSRGSKRFGACYKSSEGNIHPYKETRERTIRFQALYINNELFSFHGGKGELLFRQPQLLVIIL